MSYSFSRIILGAAIFTLISFNVVAGPTKTKESICESALSDIQNGQFLGAKVKFEDVLKKDPLFPLAKKGLEIVEDKIQMVIGQKTATYLITAVTDELADNLDEALALIDKAIVLDASYAKAYKMKGTIYAKKQLFPKAIEFFNKAIELNKMYVQAYTNRGFCYVYMGMEEKAIADFDRAIEIDDTYPHAYNNRGLVYAYQKKYQKAELDFSKAISLDPKMAKAYYNRGLVYAYSERYESAITDYMKALELTPDVAHIYYSLGMSYEKLGDKDKAIAAYQNFIKRSDSQSGKVKLASQKINKLQGKNTEIAGNVK